MQAKVILRSFFTSRARLEAKRGHWRREGGTIGRKENGQGGKRCIDAACLGCSVVQQKLDAAKLKVRLAWLPFRSLGARLTPRSCVVQEAALAANKRGPLVGGGIKVRSLSSSTSDGCALEGPRGTGADFRGYVRLWGICRRVARNKSNADVGGAFIFLLGPCDSPPRQPPEACVFCNVGRV